MSKSRRGSRRRFASTAAALAAAVASVASNMAQGAVYYWDTTTTGTWATGANWSDTATTGGLTGTVPLAADTVFFNQSSVNGAETVQLSGATSIAGITFLNTGTTTIQSSSATTQTLSVGASGLTVNSGSGAVTIGNATNAANITMTAAQSWTNNATTALTITNAVNNGGFLLSTGGSGPVSINGIMSGAGGLTVGGTSVLTLGGANTYTGAVNINSGATLKLNNAAAVSTSASVTVASGGTLDINGLNGLAQKTLTISGTGVGGLGAWYNSGAAQIQGAQTLVMAAASTIGGTARLDNRANGGTATFNMGGFTLTTSVGTGAAATYLGLVGTTISNPGNIIVSTGGVSIETTTNMAGTSAQHLDRQ